MIYIVDDIGLVVDKTRERWLAMDNTQILMSNKVITMDGEDGPPYYMYGHRLEIANRLDIKSKDRIQKFKKYPLIALRLDITERIVGPVHHFTLNLAIVHATKTKYTAEERYTNVFKPILYPIYQVFMEELRHGGFTWDGNQERPEHTKIDRPYYGTPGTEGTTNNIFSDPLDAIEIVDLRISKRNICD